MEGLLFASRYTLNCVEASVEAVEAVEASPTCLETHRPVGVLGCSILPRWLSSFISFTRDNMWFLEISLGSMNYGSEPPYSVSFPAPLHSFPGSKAEQPNPPGFSWEAKGGWKWQEKRSCPSVKEK